MMKTKGIFSKVICAAAMLGASFVTTLNVDAAVFIEGAAPPAEADEYAKKMFSTFSKKDLEYMSIPTDAKLGKGFTYYTLGEDDKLKLFDENELYCYPLVSGDKICGSVAINKFGGDEYSFSMSRNKYLESLNDLDTDINNPVSVVVNEGCFSLMNGKLVSEYFEYPYVQEEFEHTKEVLSGGNVKYSERSYNIAVQSTNSLESNIADAEDDFYSLNGDIYKTENGSFITGWQDHGKYKYYFGKNGKAVTGNKFINKILCRFSDSGIYLGKYTGKYENSGGVRYFRDGKVLTGTFTVNGKTVRTDSSGYVI